MKAREALAVFAQMGVFPLWPCPITLTDEECQNIAKNLPWHWTDIRAVFSRP